MKTIYTFTMEDKKSDIDYASKLRLLAYMLYDSIYNYYGDGNIPLDINDNIIYNKINEEVRDRMYKFDSELYGDSAYYEPFLIGNNTFGLTISDNSFNVGIIKQLLSENLSLLNIDCQVNINAFVYNAVDEKDESNREMAVRTIMDSFGIKQKKSSWFEVLMGYGKQNKKGSHRK